jgi:hypothetical protein
MGYASEVKKLNCLGCGASDILYAFANEKCPYCGMSIQYDKYCICTSSNIKNCNTCTEKIF